ncbi:MAG: carbohydrate ABC transporter permease [Treponema sp.]|jgi:raffinose/stachyose/melibiose transport system permease protein|nr:carbohydrate ABC transporter permease [Treponema sp.]
MKAKSMKVRTFSPGWILAFAFAFVWLIVTGLPFYYMIVTSFKTLGEFLGDGLFELPASWIPVNYIKVFEGSFLRYLVNSVILIAVTLTLLLLLSAFAAYPLARMKFRLNRPIFSVIVAAMSVPIYITLIPLFIMAINTNTYDTRWALIGPNLAFNLPMSVFILTSFMQSIPRELEEAAEIDGCGRFSTFFRIIFPLSRPGLATLGIYNGVVIWNEFCFVMVLTQSPAVRTLPLAVWDYQGQYSINIPLILAVLTLSSLPIILLYLFSQDKLVKGMMVGAVKG